MTWDFGKKKRSFLNSVLIMSQKHISKGFVNTLSAPLSSPQHFLFKLFYTKMPLFVWRVPSILEIDYLGLSKGIGTLRNLFFFLKLVAQGEKAEESSRGAQCVSVFVLRAFPHITGGETEASGA